MKKEHDILLRVTAILSGFTASGLISACIGSTRVMNSIESKISEQKYIYEDITDSWYDNVAYVGYNTGFAEYEYIIYWYESDTLYYQGFSTHLEPSDAIRYVEEHPQLWLSKGHELS